MKAIVPESNRTIYGTIQIIPNESTFHTVFQATPNLVLEKLIVISDEKYCVIMEQMTRHRQKIR